MPGNISGEDINFNPETAQAVLDAVREEYLSDERRHTLFISKVETIVTIGSVIFAAATFATASKDIHFYFPFLIASLVLTLFAMSICIYALRTRIFHKPEFKTALTDAELCKAPATVQINLAKTYKDANDKNKGPFGGLVSLFDWTTSFLLTSVLCLVLSMVPWEKFMCDKKDNGKPLNESNSSSSPPPQLPPTSSYGTETLKKSWTPGENVPADKEQKK